jgi:hypothetical protein
MKIKFTLFIIVIFFAIINACKNDNLEEIHPDLYCDTCIVCDTTGVINYTNDIKPIMETKCGALDVNCHKTGNVAQINLDNYNETVDAAVNGELMGSILHEPGYEPMPYNAGKLDKCSTLDIQAWINRGEPF